MFNIRLADNLQPIFTSFSFSISHTFHNTWNCFTVPKRRYWCCNNEIISCLSIINGSLVALLLYNILLFLGGRFTYTRYSFRSLEHVIVVTLCTSHQKWGILKMLECKVTAQCHAPNLFLYWVLKRYRRNSTDFEEITAFSPWIFRYFPF